MEIKTSTTSGKEITIRSIEGSYKLALSGPGLPGVVEVSHSSFHGELRGTVSMGGRERNLRVMLRTDDDKRIGSYLSGLYRTASRRENIARHADKYTEAIETGSRVFIRAELDDDMSVIRHYITPAGDLEITREGAH